MQRIENLPGSNGRFVEHLRGAGPERLLDHVRDISVRENHDGNLLKLALGANLFEDVHAVHLRQHQIEQDCIGIVFMDTVEPRLPIGARLDAISLPLQARPINVRHDWVILDDEYSLHNPGESQPAKAIGF
jgi:hypothetical protein